MKITIGRNGSDTKVLNDKGEDITRELNLEEIKISVTAAETTEVWFRVMVNEVEVNIDKDKIDSNKPLKIRT